MVPDVGLEPTTYRLQGGCSTTELSRHRNIARGCFLTGFTGVV